LNTNDALEQCLRDCRPDCDGMVRYTVPEFGDKVFTLECPVYKKRQQQKIREEKAQKKLGALAKHSFENYDQSRNLKAYELAKKYVAHRAWKQGGWLILHGGYGTGKTHLLSAIIHEAILAGALAEFANITKIAAKNFENAKTEIRELTSYDLVGLDDFGIEASQNWLIPHLFNLFDELNENGKGLVMTTNLSMKELQDVLGERISDRIVQRAVAVGLTGTSMRKNLRADTTSWSK